MAVSGQVALVPIRISGTEMEEVEDVVRSCGCMQLLDNQKELKLPEILRPMNYLADSWKLPPEGG